MSRHSSNKSCRHEKFDEKTQETLDEHATRSSEGIAGIDWKETTLDQGTRTRSNQQSTICAHSYCAAITFRFGSDSCKDFALQKNAQLLIRNIRDKLTSRRRNEDALLQELDRCYRKRGSPIRLCLSNKMQLKTKSHHLNSNLTRCKATSIVVTSA